MLTSTDLAIRKIFSINKTSKAISPAQSSTLKPQTHIQLHSLESDRHLRLSICLTKPLTPLHESASPRVFPFSVNNNFILLGTQAKVLGAIMGFSFSITFHNNLSEIFIGSIFKINADPPT